MHVTRILTKIFFIYMYNYLIYLCIFLPYFFNNIILDIVLESCAAVIVH